MSDDPISQTTEAVSKTAEATTEVAKLANNWTNWLHEIFGPASKELGLVAGNLVRYFRINNAATLHQKTLKKLNEKGIEDSHGTIPLSLGIPLIEKASICEDPTLQEKWANLLANALDPKTAENVRRSSIDILDSLDPLDARILDWIPSQGWGQMLGEVRISLMVNELEEQKEHIEVSLLNLIRLGLVERAAVKSKTGKEDYCYQLSAFGAKFLKACSAPRIEKA